MSMESVEYLQAPSWEEALTVLELLVTKLGLLEANREATHGHLQATIRQLERLAETDSYAGSRTRLYSLVESVSSICPDSSVIQLVEVSVTGLVTDISIVCLVPAENFPPPCPARLAGETGHHDGEALHQGGQTSRQVEGAGGVEGGRHQ